VADAGTKVTLAGWAHRRRDHGGVIFLDLRDREGLVQVVLHPNDQPLAYKVAEQVRSEFVLEVKGVVGPRLEGAVNPNLPTGEVEVIADSIVVLAESETPPFPIEDRVEASEEIRLRYRYLDLRRPQMQQTLRLRHRIISTIRRFFDDQGFIEVETPALNKSTPEGARDYLVPARLAPGSFFALQQSPQLFKQLLMIAGLDRYYQIVRCFRDEDPRADRQPDFTQLDMEMSFVDELQVRDTTEQLFATVMKVAVGVDVVTPFPEMTYAEAMDKFGSDKPDLRFALELVNVSAIFAQTQVQIFKKTLDSGGSAYCLGVPGGGILDRKELERLTQVARNLGAGGLAWINFKAEGISSPLAKVLSENEVAGIRQAVNAASGDLALIVCDAPDVARRAMGEVRLVLADRLGLRPATEPDDAASWKFTWIVEPPLVAYSEKEGRWDPVHHPFTAPCPADEALLDEDPGAVRARAYDLVLNGWEVAGGSVRIHTPRMQQRIFKLIGIDDETAEKRFGWFVRAFKYGAPPHGGIAAGIDRLVALLGGRDNIREVIAFPKSSSSVDLMTGAPDRVDQAQLVELQIQVPSAIPDSQG